MSMVEEILSQWEKPFKYRVNGLNCIVGASTDPVTQMKPAMAKELAEESVLAKRKHKDGSRNTQKK